jgi:predicted dehydrogenase
MATPLLPAPRTPDPIAAPPIRWGILAPGFIAGEFAAAARLHTRQELAAVASRDRSRAERFAAVHGVGRVHASYAGLVSDPAVDAVYVASPHSFHFDHALLAIEAGKHVLIEKAFTRTAAEARRLAAAGRAAGVTVMEAMWTRFLPRTDIVRRLLEDGALGEIEAIQADHGQPLTHVPRLGDPALAGGALLDLGVYPVSYAVFCLGAPTVITASGSLTGTGVDRQSSIVLSGFPDHPHAQAVLFTTQAAKTPTTASISGSTARVELDTEFYAPGTVRLVAPDGTSTTSPSPLIHRHQGMAYEIAHFAGLVAEGRTESPLLPVGETVAVMEILDEIRRQVGVRYPGEDTEA